jgi:hypothetical protein
MSRPQYLNAYSGSSNTWSGPYEWLQTGTGSESHLEIYKSNTPGHGGSNAYLYYIAVNTTTNLWVDYGSSHPFDSPVQGTEANGDVTITLSSSASGLSQLFKFEKPVVTGWGPSSTSTGESNG